MFILFWFSFFAYVEWTTVLIVRSNPNQSNRRSAVQWHFPLLWVFSGLAFKLINCWPHSPIEAFNAWDLTRTSPQSLNANFHSSALPSGDLMTIRRWPFPVLVTMALWVGSLPVPVKVLQLSVIRNAYFFAAWSNLFQYLTIISIATYLKSLCVVESGGNLSALLRLDPLSHVSL